jgi:CubicO group peptidase (beta-lactamase class C family)
VTGIRIRLLSSAGFVAVFLSASITAVAAAIAPSAPSGCELNSKALLSKASELVQAGNVPGLSAAVIVDGRIVAKGTVGVRALGGELALDSDAWHIGSITKSFTATLAARLVERDSLQLSRTLKQLVPDLLVSTYPSYGNATVQDLLCHRSGLGGNPIEDAEIEKFYEDARSLTKQRRSLARLAFGRAPSATPGEKFTYSNASYVVAGVIFEQATKQPWEQLVTTEVLEPLQLESGGFGAPGAGDSARAPVGHELTNEGLIPVKAGSRADSPAVFGPAGTMHMNMQDLARFAYRHTVGEFETDGYLSMQTYRLLHTDRGEDAALGWFTQQWRGHRLIKNTGSNGYWYAVVVAQPEKRVAIAVAANADPEAGATLAVGELVSALLRATLRGECIL